MVEKASYMYTQKTQLYARDDCRDLEKQKAFPVALAWVGLAPGYFGFLWSRQERALSSGPGPRAWIEAAEISFDIRAFDELIFFNKQSQRFLNIQWNAGGE